MVKGEVAHQGNRLSIAQKVSKDPTNVIDLLSVQIPSKPAIQIVIKEWPGGHSGSKQDENQATAKFLSYLPVPN